MPIRITETFKKMLITYVVIFILQHTVDQFLGGNFKGWFSLIPALTIRGQIWQIFTYSFLHADVMHLILNLMVLAFVGSDLEALWGRKRFIIFYSFCIAMAGLFYLLIQLLIWNPLFLSLPMMGASGGIYGLLLAYGILFPNREMLFMMLFPMKAKQFIWMLAGVQFLQAVFSGQGGLGALAHLSGMGAGFLYLWLETKNIQRRRIQNEMPKKNTSHLRLVTKEDDDQNPTKTWH